MENDASKPMVISHFEVTFVIALQLILFLGYFYSYQLPETAYFSPVLVVELLKYPLAMVFILLNLAIGVLFFRKLAWSSIDPTYGARFFATGISMIIMWQFTTYDYNFYYDQNHYLDRSFVLILASLVYCHPMFAPLFTAFAIVVASQLNYPLPEAAWLWADKKILFDAMILFNAFLFLAAFRRVTPHLFLYLALCLTGGIYFHAGIAKLSIGPAFYSWLTDNKLSNLFVSSYIVGWFGFLDPGRIVGITQHLSMIDFPLALGTLVIELSAVAILWSKKFSCVVLGGFILLHIAIGLASGIFFWMWCLYDLALIIFVIKSGSASNCRIFDTRSFVLSAAIIFFSNVYFRPVHFAWFDTRLSNFFTIYGTGASGNVYELEPYLFSPYDITFSQSRFYYLLKGEVLVGTYGSSQDYWLSQRLETADPAEINSLRATYGENFYDERLAKKFVAFVERYVTNAQKRGRKFSLLNYFAPPYHFGRFAGKNRYNFQEQLKNIQVSYEEHFFTGKEIQRIRKQNVIEIPLENGQLERTVQQF